MVSNEKPSNTPSLFEVLILVSVAVIMFCLLIVSYNAPPRKRQPPSGIVIEQDDPFAAESVPVQSAP